MHSLISVPTMFIDQSFNLLRLYDVQSNRANLKLSDVAFRLAPPIVGLLVMSTGAFNARHTQPSPLSGRTLREGRSVGRSACFVDDRR